MAAGSEEGATIAIGRRSIFSSGLRSGVPPGADPLEVAGAAGVAGALAGALAEEGGAAGGPSALAAAPFLPAARAAAAIFSACTFVSLRSTFVCVSGLTSDRILFGAAL